MKISSAQFYNSVRIDGRERQTVRAGIDGVHKDTTLEFHNGLILIDSPLEPELIVVGMTNTRSFRAEKSSSMALKQESFVFSREKPIPYLESLEVSVESNGNHVSEEATESSAEERVSAENNVEVKVNDEPKAKKKGKTK